MRCGCRFGRLTLSCTSPPWRSLQQVVVSEVLGYIRESPDEGARAEAATQLCDLAERYAPDHAWFVHTLNELFEVAGEGLPPSTADVLMRLVAEGTGAEDEAADAFLRREAVEAYLDLLERPKLPSLLLKVGVGCAAGGVVFRSRFV